MSPPTLTLAQLNRATLARQMLLAREEIAVDAAVQRLAGMQAQEARHPFVGLWTRVDGFRRDDLSQALDAREVVRGTLMRGTLHLARARDYAEFRTPLQPMLTAGMLSALRNRADGLDLDRVLPAARELFEQQPRDFNEVRKLLHERFPEMNDRALGYSVRTHLPLVMVPTGDRWAFPQTAKFTLADAWLDEQISGDTGVEPLVRSYLAAFGPATAADAQTWSGLKGLKRVLDQMRPELSVFEDERGRTLFDLPDAPRPDDDVPAPPRFLPEFDNLVLAHSDRTRLLPDEHRGRVVTKNLRVRATFLWDGFVRGTWSVQRKRKVATLQLEPFEPLPKKAKSELAEEGEALLRFVEEDADSFDVKLATAA